jgi:hypothetical protein
MGSFDSTLKEITLKRSQCKAGEWFGELNYTDFEEYYEAVNSGKYSLKVIYKALKTLGIPVTYESFRTHLKGDCKCSKNL